MYKIDEIEVYYVTLGSNVLKVFYKALRLICMKKKFKTPMNRRKKFKSQEFNQVSISQRYMNTRSK